MNILLHLRQISTAILFSVWIGVCSPSLFGQYFSDLPFYMGKDQDRWVQSRFDELSLDQKIGQLFMVAAYSNKGAKHQKKIQSQIEKYHVGGLIFMQGNPQSQHALTLTYQQISSLPLLIGMDAEWGLSMRLKNTFKFPWAMTVGATRDPNLAYRMAKEIGRQCHTLGVHLNFAPVVDINNNSKNPVIGLRSFGSDKTLVSDFAEAYTGGLQDAGVIACAKHFPGHGNTDKDSHKTLPLISSTASELDDLELFPYRSMVNKVHSIMVGHLLVPAYDPLSPSSLSPKIVNQLLKKTLKYKGLIITDALNMGAVSKRYEPGYVAVEAFRAGNDILLFPQQLKHSVNAIKEAIKNGDISIKELDRRVKKILYAKYWCGLSEVKRAVFDPKPDPFKALYVEKNRVIERKVYEAGITLLRNPKRLLPLDPERSTAVIFLGKPSARTYRKMLQTMDVRWKEVTVSTDGKKSTWRRTLKKTVRKLKDYDQVLMVVLKSNKSPWSAYTLSERECGLIEQLAASHRGFVLNLMASPYILQKMPRVSVPILLSYQSANMAQEVSAQMMFGALGVRGKLPVEVTKEYRYGQGMRLHKKRLGYSFPDAEGLDAVALSKVHKYIDTMIAQRVTPGAQLLVIRNGNVVLHRAYGNFTYKKKRPITTQDLYDVASLTKILVTVPLVMKMIESLDISPDSTLASIYEPLSETNKANLTLKQVLSHNAGLPPWIPFYRKTLDSVSHKILRGYYSDTLVEPYTISVARDRYLKRSFRDTIRQMVYHTPLLPEPHTYKYSDLGYYILKDILEYRYSKGLDTLFEEYFAHPLGLKRTIYNPLGRFPLEEIVPTQESDAFRTSGSIHGFVNDEGAALLGGVAAHAGLFSNAMGVGILMQMFLNQGTYGGKRYFSKDTFDYFNRSYYPKNRRGLGLYKPQLDPSRGGSTCGCVSFQSFGHFGFTGTYAWADPAQKTIIVFLSNRTYPSREKNLMAIKNVRTEIQRLIYLSLYQS